MTRRSVRCVYEHNNQFLLVRRSSRDRWMPGKWCFPGGQVGEDESDQEAAIREFKAETGLTLVQFHRLTFQFEQPVGEDLWRSSWWLGEGPTTHATPWESRDICQWQWWDLDTILSDQEDQTRFTPDVIPFVKWWQGRGEQHD